MYVSLYCNVKVRSGSFMQFIQINIFTLPLLLNFTSLPEIHTVLDKKELVAKSKENIKRKHKECDFIQVYSNWLCK